MGGRRRAPLRICKSTGKRKLTEDEAEYALERAHSRQGHRTSNRQDRKGNRIRQFDRKEQRAYECDFCGEWHLTSQEWRPIP